jgi:hypothetical protein
MARERLSCRGRPLPQFRLPLPFAGWQFNLAEDEVDQAVQEVGLVRHMVVEQHRFHAEDLSEPAHAQVVDAVLIGQSEGCL